MEPTVAVDYERGFATITANTYDSLVEILTAELPHVWAERYAMMCRGATNVLLVTTSGFDHLFDFCSDLGGVKNGREDRLVAAFGRTTPGGSRPASRIAGFPGSDERGDRRHFIAHAAGGGVDINLFHQNARLNRGHSVDGKRYRAMERYCAAHPDTFCFSRPIYTDETARPSEIEFGLLTTERKLWADVFENPG